MFRRKWVGLPADPHFPVDLKELGYFINEIDEIRAIDNPDNYFKFFLNRNPRWNERQRYAMNQALQHVIWERLKKLGLKKELLPTGTTDTTKPHVPIYVSRDLISKSRVVVIFGESSQDLGILAHRVVGGPGGVNKGSMVSIVSGLQQQSCSLTDMSSPGIILANMGELLWWPEGNRTLSRTAFDAMPMRSAVENGNLISGENEIPGNKDPKEHIHYIFNTVIPHLVTENARIDIIGVGDGADLVEQYLDKLTLNDEWKKRINCLALVGGMQAVWELQNEWFVEKFLRNKARAYATSLEPAGMVISGPDGNPKTTTFTQQGCPVFSSGENNYAEMTLVSAGDIVLDWLQEVALTPEGEEYENPKYHVDFSDPVFEDDPGWGQWQDDKQDGEKVEADSRDAKVQAKNGLEKPDDVKSKDKAKAGGEEPQLVLVERPNGDQGKSDDTNGEENKDEN
ncbi:Arb2 domain-containing protein [Jackrogersella minutella]|nr:Arb2 domain-containing protein [Jackrogersella minutella]